MVHTKSLGQDTKTKSRDVGIEVLYEKGWNVFSVQTEVLPNIMKEKLVYI